MWSWVLAVAVSQFPTNLTPPPIVPGPAVEVPVVAAVRAPVSKKEPSALTIIGLSLLAASMAAESLDLVVTMPVSVASPSLAVFNLIPLFGSTLTAIAVTGNRSSFATRAYIYLGVQVVGAALAGIGFAQSLSQKETSPAVAVVPVPGGALATVDVRF